MERWASSSQGLGGSGGGTGPDACPSIIDTRASMLPRGLRLHRGWEIQQTPCSRIADGEATVC
jgi:hypothetical protein